MEHLNDSELMEYAANRLPEAKSRELREHIDGCPKCEKRYRETVDLWSTLGQWRVDVSSHGIADRIMALASEDISTRRKNRVRTLPFIRSFTAALRVAAAVLIAIGAGHLLGRFSLLHNAPDSTAFQEKPRYVTALGFEWSSELMWTVLEEEAVSGETN